MFDRSRLRTATPIKTGLRGATLKLAIWFALFLVLTVSAPSHAEDYYYYKGPKGELVISNKEPPLGTKIIKRVPSSTTKASPQDEQVAKPQANPQPESSPKQSKAK